MQICSPGSEAWPYEGRSPGQAVTMAELMEACNRHAATDKTQDDNEEEKGKGPANNGGKSNNGNGGNNNNNQNQHKRGHNEGSSELVANTNAGFQRQRMDGNYKEKEVIRKAEVIRKTGVIKATVGITVVEIVIKDHVQWALKRLSGCRVLVIARTADPPIIHWHSA